MTIDTKSKVNLYKPSLAPKCSLYFDSIHNRWVIRAPNQVVFPDSNSLEVLLLCDGKQSIAQISDKLDRNKNRRQSQNVRGDTAIDVITRFISRGVLVQCDQQKQSITTK